MAKKRSRNERSHHHLYYVIGTDTEIVEYSIGLWNSLKCLQISTSLGRLVKSSCAPWSERSSRSITITSPISFSVCNKRLISRVIEFYWQIFFGLFNIIWKGNTRQKNLLFKKAHRWIINLLGSTNNKRHWSHQHISQRGGKNGNEK